MYIFVSSSLIDDVVTYSAVDSIANLSDHLPVLCVIHAAKFTGIAMLETQVIKVNV